jgi:adenylate cyclase
MKFTFRVTLLTVVLGLLVITVGGLGVSSYRNTKRSANDLSAKILEETAARIDQEINNELINASDMLALNTRLFRSGRLKADDFASLASDWAEVMAVYPAFSSLELGLEATGEWFYVRRLPDGAVRLGELRRTGPDRGLELREYRPEDYPAKPDFHAAEGERFDARRRAWYTAGSRGTGQVWSETYAAHNLKGTPAIPALCCAAPLLRGDGSREGVVGVSLNLYDLCRFLKTLDIGEHGSALVLEYRADGTRQVIGHPDPTTLLREIPGEGEGQGYALVPLEELADPVARAFLEHVPARLVPTELEGLHRFTFRVGPDRYLGAYSRLSTDRTPDWIIGILLPEDDFLGTVRENNLHWLLVSGSVVLLAVFLALVLSRLIAHYLEVLHQETEAIAQLRLEPRPVHSIVYEVDRLAVAVEEMKAGLRSFQKYVPADLVRKLMASGREAQLGGERREVTISFSDVADFTAISETLTPEQLVEHLGEYLSSLSDGIEAAGGTVDKYIGDAVMAFWGAPAPNPRHAAGACVAALRNLQRLRELQQKWRAEGKPVLRARTGICTGEVVVGNIGSAVRLNYTVMGDAVNLASRLEGLNKYYGTTILVSDTTYREAQADVVARPVDWVSVKGKSEAILVHELLALKEEADRADVELADTYASALAAYRRQDWPEALRLFEATLRLRPEDPPSRLMIARCQAYRQAPPGDAWDGVTRMQTK